MGWDNEQYAKWMISKRVKEAVLCLVEVGDSEQVFPHLPKELYQISNDGLRGNDLFNPSTGGWFQRMYYLKKDKEYVIGLSEPVKTMKREGQTINQLKPQ